jgi:hypothetical protein
MRFAVAALFVIGCGDSPQGTDIDAPPSGDGGTDAATDSPPASTCPSWCVETAPVPASTRLFSVHARDSSDVFAVGDGGVIVRRQNDTWTAMTSGTTENLRGVWAASANDAWAVGTAGTVLRWNGTSWTQVVGVLPIDYTGVWGSSANDVWLIGTSRVQHWTGSAWATPVTVPGTLMSVHGSGPTDVWVSGEPTYLKHYTGTWATVMPGGGSTQYVVEAISATNVWSVAPGSGSRQWNGTTWTPHASDAFTDLHALGANDIWGVSATKAGHWDGAAWTSSTPPGVTQNLWGVSGAGGHVWIVGSGAMILHRN